MIAGVGYAWADLDQPITGRVGSNPVTIDDDNGYTLNVGGGVKYEISDAVLVRLDARYRYFDELVDELDESLDTVETTIGIGWRF